LTEHEDMEGRARRSVKDFEEAATELAEFHDVNAGLMNLYSQMVEKYNTCLAAAQQNVRATLDAEPARKEVVIGPIGVRRTIKVTWDGDKLATSIPGNITDLFLTPFYGYNVDGKELERLLRIGEVDSVAAQVARTEKSVLRALPGTPKPIVISFERPQ